MFKVIKQQQAAFRLQEGQWNGEQRLSWYGLQFIQPQQSAIQAEQSDKMSHSARTFPTSVCNARSCTLFHIRWSSSESCGTHGLHAVAASSHGPPALFSSHSKLPFGVCFWAPSWGPWPWESSAQRAHNPIWQEMVGMPGYIHSRAHSPTWLAQRLLLKAGARMSARTHTETHRHKETHRHRDT